MKRIIISILLAVVTANAFAQNTVSAGITTVKKNVTISDERITGPVLKFGLMYGGAFYFGTKLTTDNQKEKINGVSNALNLSVGFGYQITPKLYSGAVVGLSSVDHQNGPIVPILGEVRYYLSEKAKSSIFFDAEVGYNPVGLSENGQRSLKEGTFIVDKGLVAGVGTGWSSSKISFRIGIEYNNAMYYTLDKANMFLVGLQFNYYIRFGRKYVSER